MTPRTKKKKMLAGYCLFWKWGGGLLPAARMDPTGASKAQIQMENLFNPAGIENTKKFFAEKSKI